MRCFVAIDFPEHVKLAIGEVIRKVGEIGKGAVKWVPPANMHLTLKFLGEVQDKLVPGIQTALASACAGHNRFSLNVRGAGFFPNARNPNILWIGIEASPNLDGLFQDIDRHMAGLGFEPETRRFSAHLTVGRVKNKRGIQPVVDALTGYGNTSFGTIEVKEILLMKSVLKPSGAEYFRVGVVGLV